ncbi:TonB family protein [Methylophilus sp. 13]|uniref:TonB family protein n=1 Tax=Methylophilus sp. 13 TaxID=2781018 RepID=UPI0018905A89|nr:TonB family protein [Methylophilus sp. 13]MBF5040466.1 TonB family protein [Methylophilus sp. 13]
MNIYQILGIESDADIRQIKQAYAKQIKHFRPDTHPVEFGNIRQAYEIALAQYETFRLNHEQKNVHPLEADQFTNQTLNNEDSLLSHPDDAPDKAHSHEEKLPVFKYLIKLTDLAGRGDEQAAKQLTQRFLDQLQFHSLDESSAIELEILNWIFTFNHPLLLTFITLDNYYSWTTSRAFSLREFQENEIVWLEGFRKLADDYQAAITQKNINLAQTKTRLPVFLLSKSDLLARKRWQITCDELNVPLLKSYYKSPSESKFPITREDMIFSSLAAGFLLLISSAVKVDAISFVLAGGAFFATLAFRTFVWPLLNLLTKQNKFIYQFRYFIYTFLVVMFFQGAGYISHELSERANMQKEVVLSEMPVICNGTDKRENPVYPKESRELGEEGRAEVKFLVGTNGAVVSAEIQKTSGFERLDNESLRIVKRWCFSPPEQEAYGVVPIDYRLDSQLNRMGL